MLLPRRESRKLWMLLIALGLVVMTIRQLNKPSTVHKLEKLFSPQLVEISEPIQPELTLGKDGAIQTPNKPVEKTVIDNMEQNVSPSNPTEHLEEVPGLSQVEDKTYFRPLEQEAWFFLFDKLQKTKKQEISAKSVGEVTYAQLHKQPDAYRGQVVTIRGTVMREEAEPAGENQLGIESFHRLWILPYGGGPSLFVTYCLELPPGFPRGEKRQSAVTVTGYFFKNWSYSWEGGLALAPVVLAESFAWHQPVSRKRSTSVSTIQLVSALVATCLFGLIVAWLAYRHTSRPLSSIRLEDDRSELLSDWQEPGSSTEHESH